MFFKCQTLSNINDGIDLKYLIRVFFLLVVIENGCFDGLKCLWKNVFKILENYRVKFRVEILNYGQGLF